MDRVALCSWQCSRRQYLCCYTEAQLAKQVYPALDSVVWQPLNISYTQARVSGRCMRPAVILAPQSPVASAASQYACDARCPMALEQVVCNVDGSVILMADDASQAAFGALVQRFEAAIAATGLPVVPRRSMEGFHVTIGTTNATYPMQARVGVPDKAPEQFFPYS